MAVSVDDCSPVGTIFAREAVTPSLTLLMTREWVGGGGTVPRRRGREGGRDREQVLW